MPTIYELKEAAVTETPLLLFDCTLINGQTEHWSTHGVTVGAAAYEPRVLSHNVFEMQAATAHGVDGIPQISLSLANADSHFSEVERATGWKGAKLTVRFVFYDLRNRVEASEATVVFQGACDPPVEMREATFRLSATNRMSLQRALLPQIRIQRRCPWNFPAGGAQRSEALNGGVEGKYSRFYRCGYSADVANGLGSLDGAEPFTRCGFTRTECQARGMWTHFGGIEFVPPAITVRATGKDWQNSSVAANVARYNDFVPMIYGTAWYAAPVVFGRNDGNLTRLEVLLGAGEMAGVLTVLVNDVAIPEGISGRDMTATGWYNVVSLGGRAGNFNLNFTDGQGQPAGDPYGSMAYLSVVVPTRISNGTTLPAVKVLVQGLKVPTYSNNGLALGEQFSSNPAWILLDVLRRTGWRADEIDIASFTAAAAYCDELITALDLNGNQTQVARFQCNLALVNRRSAGDVARGIRSASRLLLTYDSQVRVQVRVENALAAEQPSKPAWSNSAQPLNGGWPSYEFGDGTSGFGGILRKADGEPSVRVYSRSVADAPNRYSVEFQDAMNGYQQDSFSIVDAEDAARCGQEVSASSTALGLPHYDQAARVLALSLHKSVRGNTYIEFDTSVRALGVRPGDLITVTYLKEGFQRQLFRVIKVAPGTNYRVTAITAQIHDDAWYSDANGQSDSAPGAGWQGNSGVAAPLPLVGAETDENGLPAIAIEEESGAATGGSGIRITARYAPRPTRTGAGPGVPLVSLIPSVGAGGALAGGEILYYALTAVDASGNESAPSFVVKASIVSGNSRVTLTGLSFAPGTAAFNAYRGVSPAQMFRIADNLPPAGAFVDVGLAAQTTGLPDANFDHANFYWRMELAPETAATIHSGTTVGNSSLRVIGNAFVGMIARLTRGAGAGQERVIEANTETTLTVSPGWAVEPDSTSHFCVAESGWQFGAETKSDSAQFQVPNRSGETVHITGRAANVNQVESAPELNIVSRWKLGGATDAEAPPRPLFALNSGRQSGTVELSSIAFEDLTNTRTVSSATLTLRYWDELQGAPSIALAEDIDPASSTITLTQAGPAQAGSYLQIDREVLTVIATQSNGTIYEVTRGVDGSSAAAHAVQAPVYHLESLSAVVPFPRDFFGSPYGGNWRYAVPLPDARVASAELFVTNQKGQSLPGSACFTAVAASGLRTLSGGQYTIQVEGFLAVDQSAAPPLLIEASHALRDIYAVLGSAADEEVQVRLNLNNSPYCTLTFEAGSTTSDSVFGYQLPPLAAGSTLTLSILSTGHATPGADLTVLIRL